MRLRDLLSPVHRIKYLLWRASRSKSPILVKLLDGKRLYIRPSPAMDLPTAYEIFINQAYKKPEDVPDQYPGLILDLGANVGFSIIHFAYLYPAAQVVAFEPHPQHISMLYKNIYANKLTDRVEVIESAASNCDGEGFLTDKENESATTMNYQPGNLPIKKNDVFLRMGERRIDLLKMDIEGGEYDILGDKRFEMVDVRTIVMEWHDTVSVPSGRRWCADRLASLGFNIADGQLRYDRAGILWAWRN